MTKTMTIATCQFAVTDNPKHNGRIIRRQMRRAKESGAEIVHFSECSLSGYAGAEFSSWDGYDWSVLADETEEIFNLASQLKLYIILGSSHPLGEGLLPHNSLYLISDRGQIADRYDKSFCTGGDLKCYTCGSHLTTFEFKGVKCGLLICYDFRFPEIHRAYQQEGVFIIFHSFYQARRGGKPGVLDVVAVPTIQTRAAENFTWIIANNTSVRHSSWPSLIVRPDGIIAAQLQRHRAGVLVHTIDLEESAELYNAAGPYIERSVSGILYSGTPTSVDRSTIRQTPTRLYKSSVDSIVHV